MLFESTRYLCNRNNNSRYEQNKFYMYTIEKVGKYSSH